MINKLPYRVPVKHKQEDLPIFKYGDSIYLRDTSKKEIIDKINEIVEFLNRYE